MTARLPKTREMIARLIASPSVSCIHPELDSSNRGVIEFYRRIGFKDDDVLSLGKRLEEDGPS